MDGPALEGGEFGGFDWTESCILQSATDEPIDVSASVLGRHGVNIATRTSLTRTPSTPPRAEAARNNRYNRASSGSASDPMFHTCST